MTARRLCGSGLTLAFGYAISASLYWLLLNVPESTVPALAASCALVVAAAACIGFTTGTAAAIASGTPIRQTPARGAAALPGFALGVIIFAVLWGITGTAASSWDTSRGEIDALAIRYFHTDRTEPLHTMVAWLLWLLRWGLGLSMAGGATVAASVPASERRAASGPRSGLQAGGAVLSVLAVAAAAVLVAEGLWRLAYWRPRGLPASASEVVFVSVKLALLYLATIAVTTGVLAVLGRAVRRRPA